ncbi:MAG: 4'-phosphopantetheinyl transferase superfamily protein [Coprococcus sp.]|nr:4'-phosphopantetheinyl transferase superfamily protein [Coprococcus sp.]
MQIEKTAHKVYIYACSIADVSLNECNEAIKFLFPERRKKYDRYRRSDDKKRCLVASMVLDYVLLKHFGVEDIGWYYGDYGKPFLKEYANISFSVSHAGEWVVVAVGNCNVGIDIEEKQKDMDCLFNAVLSRNEKGLAEQMNGDEADDYFVMIWTVKEAYSKMIGIGLSKKFTELDVSYLDAGISISDRDNIIKTCCIVQKKFKDTYWCSICVEGINSFLSSTTEVSFREIMRLAIKSQK